MRYPYPRKWTSVKIDGIIYKLPQEEHDNILGYSKNSNGEFDWNLYAELIKAARTIKAEDSFKPTEEDITIGNF